MKKTTNLLLAGVMAALCCSTGNAQISYTNTLATSTLIYSNGFDGAAVNITNTPPDYAASIFGGTNNAVWLDAGQTNDNGAFLANGTVTCVQGDTILLPFNVQSNLVYTFTVSANFLTYPGNWIAAGFARYYRTNATVARLNDVAVSGYDWALWQGNNTSVQYFGGVDTGNTIYAKSGIWSPHTGIHTLTLILDTTTYENSSNRWTAAGFLMVFNWVTTLAMPVTVTPQTSGRLDLAKTV